jgi:hypothetical protein
LPAVPRSLRAGGDCDARERRLDHVVRLLSQTFGQHVAHARELDDGERRRRR